jgi:hypothetical protein
MGTQNAELLNYFSHRRVWRLNGDDPDPQLLPYDSTFVTRPVLTANPR